MISPGRHLATIAILTLGMGVAVAVGWFVSALVFGGLESYSLAPVELVTPQRLLAYGTEFLIGGAFVYWQAHSRLRGVASATLAVLVIAAWLGEGLVLIVIGEPIVANELDPEIAWYYWLVATAGPLQPAAASAAGWLGLRHAR